MLDLAVEPMRTAQSNAIVERGRIQIIDSAVYKCGRLRREQMTTGGNFSPPVSSLIEMRPAMPRPRCNARFVRNLRTEGSHEIAVAGGQGPDLAQSAPHRWGN
jgi:hypothetical protein